MEILFKPTFVRQVDKLEKDLQEEVFEKIELFKSTTNHKILKVHKLHGRLKDCFSFSVNYEFRIVFAYINKKQVRLIAIGDHDMYK